jgi:hypothetical protein
MRFYETSNPCVYRSAANRRFGLRPHFWKKPFTSKYCNIKTGTKGGGKRSEGAKEREREEEGEGRREEEKRET